MGRAVLGHYQAGVASLVSGADKMREAKANKQFVSRGAYVRAQGMRLSIGLTALILTGIAALCGMAALFCGFGTVVCGFVLNEPWTVVLPVLGAALLFTFFAYLSGRAGLYSLWQAAQIRTGIPFTRANTADLPALDSLVRASQEPAQAQEGVLLRASSGEAQAGREEQLLRASVGEE